MCHGENPSKMSTTLLLVFLPNHLFCQKVVEVVIAWKGKSMGNFELGRAPSFGMSCFACMDKKTPEPYANLTHTLTFWFYSHVLGAAGRSGSFIPSLFSIRVEALQQLSSSCVYPSCSVSVFPW